MKWPVQRCLRLHCQALSDAVEAAAARDECAGRQGGPPLTLHRAPGYAGLDEQRSRGEAADVLRCGHLYVLPGRFDQRGWGMHLLVPGEDQLM
jgi:hypothetical protein